MARMDALILTVHEAELERLIFVQAGKLNARDGTAIGETGGAMDVRGVSGFCRGDCFPCGSVSR